MLRGYFLLLLDGTRTCEAQSLKSCCSSGPTWERHPTPQRLRLCPPSRITCTSMATLDRGYLNLLQHLRRRESKLSKDTLNAAISHFLVHLPLANPIPTPLVAFVVTSQLWHPFDLQQLLSVGSAFRSAVHLKYEMLKKESRGLFGGTVSSLLSDWTRNVLSGLENGDSIMKMAVCGGTLMGLNDIQSKVAVKSRHKVEESLVLNFSEVLEEASAQPINSDGAWEKEFLPRTEDSHST